MALRQSSSASPIIIFHQARFTRTRNIPLGPDLLSRFQVIGPASRLASTKSASTQRPGGWIFTHHAHHILPYATPSPLPSASQSGPNIGRRDAIHFLMRSGHIVDCGSWPGLESEPPARSKAVKAMKQLFHGSPQQLVYCASSV